MNNLKMIWPTLGQGVASFPRNLSWTKKGPGRRHSILPKKMTQLVEMFRNNGVKVNPKELHDTVK